MMDSSRYVGPHRHTLTTCREQIEAAGFVVVTKALADDSSMLTLEHLTEALHHIHSFDLWQWWEPEHGGGAIVRKGTSPDFAAALLRALAETKR